MEQQNMANVTFNPAVLGVSATGGVNTRGPVAKKEAPPETGSPAGELVTLSGAKAPAEMPAPAAAQPATLETPREAPQQAPAAAPAPGPGISNGQGGTLLMTETPVSEHNATIDGFLARLAGISSTSETKEVPTITAAQVNWDKGADVVSNAQKFVIPVPSFEGEPLVYPAGAKDKNGNEIGGNPIADWQGQPIGDKGVVFFNQKDQAWQAVKSDGQGVVIMNQMTEAQADLMMSKIGGDPNKMNLEQFKAVLTYANSDEVGCKDMYNSDRDFISKKMNAMETSTTGIPQFGLFRRDDRDVCKALVAEGPAEFEAPTTGGITVKQPIPKEGGMLVRQPDGKFFLSRKVHLEVFPYTYTHKDASKVVLDEMPRHKPE